jgi:hypothetical protein
MFVAPCHHRSHTVCDVVFDCVHSGTRRTHTFAPVGPLDCTECELRLAERWCVSCDEHFCDGCWRKVRTSFAFVLSG